MEKANKKKVCLISIGLILLVIVVYVAIWFINYTKYVKWEKKLQYDEFREMYILKEGDYTFGVAKPKFPDFTGNFWISETIRMTETEEEKVSFDIIIWPKSGDKFEIGVMIGSSKYNEVTKMNETISYQIMLDEKRELVYDHTASLTEDEKQAVEAYEDFKDELDVLLNRADELWGIFE